MVDACGLPHFILTLTADEHSDIKWTEIHDLEEMLRWFTNSLTHSHAPVECVAHFI